MAQSDSPSPGQSREKHIRLLGRSIPLPQTRIWRIVLGAGLIVMGLAGFLPVLGFWMLPLGVLVLSYDIAFVRRLRRRLVSWWGRRRKA